MTFQAWKQSLYIGTSPKDESSKQQAFVVNVYSLLTLISLLLLGILHILLEVNPVVGYLELTGGITTALNTLAIRFTRNIALARTNLLLIIFAVLVVMLITGGIESTGIFWLFTFPTAAFFLAGRRGGIAWMSALLATITTLGLLNIFNVISLPYSRTTLRQLVISLVIVSIGIYAYQRSREMAIRRKAEVEHSKSEFVTLASHQLRTPISAIAWDSELLLSGDLGKLKSAQLRYMRQIAHSNNRMAALVDAMLMASRLELGSMPINPETVDIVTLSREVLQAQKKTFPLYKHLVIQEDYDPTLKLMLADPVVVKTVLYNLVANAFKYTPAKGIVTIQIAPSGEKLGSSTENILIKVTDTGYGIPKEDQAKISTKLFRANNIKHKDTDGTGLGLYIVKTLTEYVGGRMWFTSRENKGSQFYVLLPTVMKPRLGHQGADTKAAP